MAFVANVNKNNRLKQLKSILLSVLFFYCQSKKKKKKKLPNYLFFLCCFVWFTCKKLQTVHVAIASVFLYEQTGFDSAHVIGLIWGIPYHLSNIWS